MLRTNIDITYILTLAKLCKHHNMTLVISDTVSLSYFSHLCDDLGLYFCIIQSTTQAQQSFIKLNIGFENYEVLNTFFTNPLHIII